ncbi:MAG: ACP phosphodiesterase [Flavobacteriaceae bacterium]
MNFLAHLFLSENYPKIMIGNFIADHIKGNQYTHLDPTIQKGIKLHREIDTFTDSHEITRMSKRRLHKRYGLFAGIVIDIFYDHYLAKNWNNYSAIPLKIYVNSFYDLVYSYQEVLPEKTLKMIPYMIKYDWLFNYQYKEGIKNVLEGMNRKTKNKGQIDLAIHDLRKLDKDFEKDFELFFTDLQRFSHQKIKELSLQNTYL